jgi:hypothetical protein
MLTSPPLADGQARQAQARLDALIGSADSLPDRYISAPTSACTSLEQRSIPRLEDSALSSMLSSRALLLINKKQN